MSSVPSRLRVSTVDGCVVAEFVDRNILDEANIAQIGMECTEIVRRESHPRLIVSFKNVDHLSSAAQGTLIDLHRQVYAKDGRLALSDMRPQIHSIFVIQKLTRLFRIYQTVERALEYMRHRPLNAADWRFARTIVGMLRREIADNNNRVPTVLIPLYWEMTHAGAPTYYEAVDSLRSFETVIESMGGITSDTRRLFVELMMRLQQGLESPDSHTPSEH